MAHTTVGYRAGDPAQYTAHRPEEAEELVALVTSRDGHNSLYTCEWFDDDPGEGLPTHCGQIISWLGVSIADGFGVLEFTPTHYRFDNGDNGFAENPTPPAHAPVIRYNSHAAPEFPDRIKLEIEHLRQLVAGYVRTGRRPAGTWFDFNPFGAVRLPR